MDRRRLLGRVRLRLSAPAVHGPWSLCGHDLAPAGGAPGRAFGARRPPVAFVRRLPARAVGAVEAAARRRPGRLPQPWRGCFVAILWPHAPPGCATGRTD